MNQAALYTKINELQRRDAELMLNEYASLLQWRSDGRDRLIDIGTGSGDVLMDYVYPLMPSNFELLMGTDISADMVSYANKRYSVYERTKFELLDIATQMLPQHLFEHFDHVTSFYCLHWIPDQLKALKNIYNLLSTDGGDCLQLVLGSHFIFDVYESLAKHTKWRKYLYDFERYVSPLQHSVDPAARFGQLLKQAGFAKCRVENRTMIYVYESLPFFREFAKAVCPFLIRIPTEMHEEFLDEIINEVKIMNLCESDENSENIRIISKSRTIIAYARKHNKFEIIENYNNLH